jgi:hypothetical protein
VRLADLKASLERVASPEAFRALYDQEQIDAEIIAEVAEISAANFPREVLVEHLAVLWVNYQVLHALFEHQARTLAGLTGLQLEDIESRSRSAKAGAEALHKANTFEGRSVAERKQAVREAWASGKYSSKDACADAEHKRVGLAWDTARKALKGT